MPKEIRLVINMVKLIRKLISATIECPICGQETSDRPERCSHCGNKL